MRLDDQMTGAAEARIADLERQLGAAREALSKRHFVSDYTELVQRLIESHPLDEAMEIAVGGAYEATGTYLVSILKEIGLRDNMSVVELGCGSGRVSHQLGKTFASLQYTGIDIVQSLLDYAKTKSPDHFVFLKNDTLSLPLLDNSADFFVAFSVFTHLLHEESYLYLADAARVVKSGGHIVFTILESERNWPIFEHMIAHSRVNARKDHLNMIIERSQVHDWARRLGLEITSFDLGGPHEGHGQTVVSMRRR